MSIDVELFTSFSLFRDMPRAELRQFATFFNRRTLADNETVLRQGTGRGGFFVVLSGILKVVRELPGSREYVVSRLQKGNVFGHFSLIDGLPRTASVRAEGAAVVAEMSASDFHLLLGASESLNLWFLRMLCRDVVRTIRFVNRRFTLAATMPQADFLANANIEALLPDLGASDAEDLF
jgi:CRP-like cAMP-binding protein